MYYKCVCVYSIIVFLQICQAALQPNIVLIVTDDQDSFLGGIIPMNYTRENIGKQGITFLNSFATAPICCPSRASILTGLYPHNHKTTNNSIAGGCSSRNWQNKFEPKTFAPQLQKNAGYKTFYAGKYLNEYGKHATGGPKHVPQGWNEWRGLVGNSRYYNFTLSHNGVPKHYFENEYLTDVISEEAVLFLKNFNGTETSPFLMVLAPPAPHAPFEPALRHKGLFNNTEAPRTPNFNILKDKERHWFIKKFSSPLSEEVIKTIDKAYQHRWETLLSVDEMVETIINTLTANNLLENTYIIFTSDNGYHMGQFGLPLDKRLPYETDIRVPLMIRGPGILPNMENDHPIINIDLAPTILKMAGLTPPHDMDGIPIPVFNQINDEETFEYSISTNSVNIDDLYDREMLIEYSGEGRSNNYSDCPVGNDKNLFMCMAEYECKCQDSKNNTYTCIRHLHPAIDMTFCAFHDDQKFEEAYDLKIDKYQQQNIVRDLLPGIRSEYRNHIQTLVKCSGKSCNQYNNVF